jgi:hypothetical protein
MLSDILEVFSLGRKLIGAVSDLRRDIGSLRASEALNNTHGARLDVLEGTLSRLESQDRLQNTRIAELELGLRDTLRATEALAERVGVTFWIAVAGCGAGIAALILSVVGVIRTIH